MSFPPRLLSRYGHILLYGAAMSGLVLILKWLQWKFLIRDHSLEIYIGLIALLFTALGTWIAGQLTKPKIRTVIIEKEIPVIPHEIFAAEQKELENLNLSTREYEVLLLLGKGCSNAEIGEQLFVSLSTVKTHVSNLFVKLDVKSRTQALEKAKRLNVIP